ncbi:MAG: ankyrin repeat domain-containing protein [Gammaproteobacteria bacterium]
MRGCALILFLLCLLGNLSACSAEQSRIDDYFTDPQSRALVTAAVDGNTKEIERLVASGVNVNARGKDGVTSLIWAIYHLKKAGYQALLEHGADPNMQVQNGTLIGDSVMETAARMQDSSYLKLALQHRGNPNLVNKSSYYDYNPLISAIMADRKTNVDLLIQAGADINATVDGFSGQTPLDFAVGEQNYEIAYRLLQAGANYRITDPYQAAAGKGSNPIVWGLEHGDLDPASDRYKWREKVIQFLNAHGVVVSTKPPPAMCTQDLGKGVKVIAPCNQLKPAPQN